MKTLAALKRHIKDNRGDENITKMIWISVAFIIGAIVIAILTNAFRGPIANWFNNKIAEWFNNDNGSLIDRATNDPQGPGFLGDIVNLTP